MDLESRSSKKNKKTRINCSMREIKVGFNDIKVKKAFEALKTGKSEDRELYDAINKVMDKLKLNPKCGDPVPKRLIPKHYGDIDNLWEHDLPKVWRLLYTLEGDEVTILAIILEWMNHKNYERRFGY